MAASCAKKMIILKIVWETAEDLGNLGDVGGAQCSGANSLHKAVPRSVLVSQLKSQPTSMPGTSGTCLTSPAAQAEARLSRRALFTGLGAIGAVWATSRKAQAGPPTDSPGDIDPSSP